MTLVAGLGITELMILVVLFGLVTLVAVLGLYWVIRVATRHGSGDAHRQAGGDGSRPPA
jgi:hypothetical protein